MKLTHFLAHAATFIVTSVLTVLILAAIFKPIPPAPQPQTPTALQAQPEQIPGCIYVDPKASKDF